MTQLKMSHCIRNNNGLVNKFVWKRNLMFNMKTVFWTNQKGLCSLKINKVTH